MFVTVEPEPVLATLVFIVAPVYVVLVSLFNHTQEVPSYTNSHTTLPKKYPALAYVIVVLLLCPSTIVFAPVLLTLRVRFPLEGLLEPVSVNLTLIVAPLFSAKPVNATTFAAVDLGVEQIT